MEKRKVVKKQIENAIAINRYLADNTDALLNIAEQVALALEKGNKVLIFGNGGSAADAQHIAAELAGRFYKERPPLPAIALTTNTSSLTAIANDYGYEELFAHQIKGLAKQDDIAIGISTSGNSPNVIKGIEQAKRLGVVTIAFTGSGGKLRGLADYELSIPSTDTPRIQEAHITAGHIICYLVEEALFGGNLE